MRVLVIPVSILVLGYVPGYATARWYRARVGIPLVPTELSPFTEILLSLCLSSWVGFLLAECGLFSLERVLVVGLLYSGALIGGSWVRDTLRRTPRRRRGRLRRNRALLSGVATALLAGALYFPPYETIIMASDASFYFNTGIHLARHGSISIPDPLLDELRPADRALLLPPNETGGYARVPGGVLVPFLDTNVVHPTFSHLLPVWMAFFYDVGGLGACGLVATAFAALSLWAICLFSAETRGYWPAALTVALVATSFSQFWFGRFPMPEILAQFFLWAGLLHFVLWWRHGSAPAAALSALSLGIAGFTRIEYLLLVPVAVGLHFGLAPERPRGAQLFGAIYAALFVHGLAHLILVPTHYRDVIYSRGLALWSALAALYRPELAAGAAALAALLFLSARLLAGRLSVGVRTVAALSVAAAYAATFAYLSAFKASTSFAWLATTVPWPVLAVAGIGLVLGVRESARAGDWSLAFPFILFLVVATPFLYDPQVTPIQLWATRRFVPVVLPFAYLFAVTALDWGHRQFARGPATVLSVAGAVALLAINARPVARIYDVPFFPDQKRTVRALAETIPPGAVVFFPNLFTDVLIPVPLWLVYDRESFLLPGRQAREAMRAGVRALSQRHRVFFVGHGYRAEPVVDGLEFRYRETVRLETTMPELHALRAPTEGRELVIPLRVYEVFDTSQRP